MRVYRVEHKDTPDYQELLKVNDTFDPPFNSKWRGPYGNDNFRFKHNDYNGRPIPSWDLTPTHLFGFKDLESFRKWFDYPDRQVLRAHGFCLAVIEVTKDPIIQSYTGQLAFKAEFATKLEIIPLED